MGRVWLGARSACPPPLRVPVCGVGVRAGVWVVCVLVRLSRVSPAPPGWGSCAGVVCLCARPACFTPFLAGVRCVGVRAGRGSRLCPALFRWVVGVCFLRSFFWACLGLALWCRLLAVPVPGLVVPVPPSPFCRAGLLALFFFFPALCVSACFGVPSPGGPLFLVWCCRFWLGGPPVPLWGFCLRCLLGGGFGRLLWCWRAVWWLWAVLSPPRPSPPLFSFLGGGLPVPPSAFPGLAHALARIQCGLPGCCWRLRSAWPCPGPTGRVGYVHVWLGGLSCRVRSWLCRLGGCARRLRVALG